MRPKKISAPHTSHGNEVTERIQKINVLVVISSQKAAELIRSMFVQLGFHHIFVASDAAEAVQMLRELHVHLVVADSELKVNDEADDTLMQHIQFSGIHFVHRLRNAPMSPAPFVPVLMLMDHAQSNAVRMARDAGVNELVLKPMQARDFCQRVIQLIDKPRIHITASTYKGPCRRRKGSPPPGVAERRVRDIRVIRCDEMKGICT